jgi:hypothetical protein
MGVYRRGNASVEHPAYRKGTRLIFLGRGVVVHSGDADSVRPVGRRQTKVQQAFSVLVNGLSGGGNPARDVPLESVYPEREAHGRQSAPPSGASGALRMARENPRA